MWKGTARIEVGDSGRIEEDKDDFGGAAMHRNTTPVPD